MLYDNTTVTGSWMNIQNMTLLSNEHHRTMNNVTMAMPHAGVFAAARDSRNGIVQPQDLNVSSAHDDCEVFDIVPHICARKLETSRSTTQVWSSDELWKCFGVTVLELPILSQASGLLDVNRRSRANFCAISEGASSPSDCSRGEGRLTTSDLRVLANTTSKLRCLPLL